jgi:hypothetical protein
MAGLYTAHHATCLACQVAHQDGEGRDARSPADHLYVTDDAPDGFTPDPRMMPSD